MIKYKKKNLKNNLNLKALVIVKIVKIIIVFQLVYLVWNHHKQIVIQILK